MKTILTILAILVSFSTLAFGIAANATSPALTEEEHCQAKAAEALAKVGEVLGLGKGVGHIGGTMLVETKTDGSGNTIHIFNGGALAAENMEGYITGSGAIIEMIVTKHGCEVNNMDISTGADVITDFEKLYQQ